MDTILCLFRRHSSDVRDESISEFLEQASVTAISLAHGSLPNTESVECERNTSDFSPESLPLKVVLFQQLCRSEVFNPDLCEKVEFESEQILAFSNLL